MGIIIDTCVYSDFFRKEEFSIALRSIKNPNGPSIVYGGSKYIEEINEKRLLILSEFQKINKVIKLNSSEVDEVEEKCKLEFKHKDHDDPHIIAMCLITGCRIIATKDVRMNTPLTYFFKSKNKPILYHDDSQADKLFNRKYRL